MSVNDPEEKPGVLEFLKTHKATHRNLLFATADVYGLQAAFDPKMPAPVPFTILLAPNGDVVYQELGELSVKKLRRAILANLPEDPKFPGHNAYWSNGTLAALSEVDGEKRGEHEPILRDACSSRGARRAADRDAAR